MTVLVPSLSSVGGNVASDPTYDVVIVRHASLSLDSDSDAVAEQRN